MKWIRDKTIERHLDRSGASWHYATVKIKSISKSKGKQNQARHTAIDEEHAIKIGMAMEEEGAIFPSIVVYKDGKTYVAIDGNHRFEGFTLTDGFDPEGSIPVYVVDSDDKYLIELVTRSFNVINGAEQGKEETIHHIIHLHEVYGTSVAELCKQWNRKPKAVNDELRRRRTRQVLADNKVPVHKLLTSHISSLVTLRNEEPVLIKAANTIVEYDLGTERTTDLVRDIKKRKTEKSKLEEIDALRQHMHGRNGKGGRYSTHKVRDRLESAIHKLMEIVNHYPTREHLQLTAKSDVVQARAAWDHLKEKMDEVLNAK